MVAMLWMVQLAISEFGFKEVDKMEKKTISFEKHKEIGMMCKILNGKLVTMEVRTINSAKNHKEGRKEAESYHKANEALSSFKNHMEEIMFLEYPKRATTSIYYGKRPDDFEV